MLGMGVVDPPSVVVDGTPAEALEHARNPFHPAVVICFVLLGRCPFGSYRVRPRLGSRTNLASLPCWASLDMHSSRDAKITAPNLVRFLQIPSDEFDLDVLAVPLYIVAAFCP